MADLTPRQTADDKSDLESGEERDHSDSEHETTTNPTDPQNQAMKKRKRARVWQAAAVDEDLSRGLSKSVKVDASKPSSFVDLDAPAASSEETAERSVAYQNNVRNNNINNNKRQSFPRGPGPVQLSNPAASASSVRGGEKRKNTMKPKSKRKNPGHPGGNVTTYFSLYPDWNSEVNDDDSLDIAARKAVFRLKEKFNPGTITQIVMHIGNAETRRLLQMTKTIEHHGGMLTVDNKSRRSPGGVFITLFKSDAEKQMGKEAVKNLLAKPKEGINKEKRAAKKARSVKKRAERRAVAAEQAKDAETVPIDDANLIAADVPILSKIEEVSDDLPGNSPVESLQAESAEMAN